MVSPESYPVFFGMFSEAFRAAEEGDQGEGGGGGGRGGGGGGGGGGGEGKKAKVVRFVNMVGRQEGGEEVEGGGKGAGKVPGGGRGRGLTCLSSLATLVSPCGGSVAIGLSLQPMSSAEDVWATVVGMP